MANWLSKRPGRRSNTALWMINAAPAITSASALSVWLPRGSLTGAINVELFPVIRPIPISTSAPTEAATIPMRAVYPSPQSFASAERMATSAHRMIRNAMSSCASRSPARRRNTGSTTPWPSVSQNSPKNSTGNSRIAHRATGLPVSRPLNCRR